MSTAVVQVPVREVEAGTIGQPHGIEIPKKPWFVDEHPFTVLAIFIIISLGVSLTLIAALAMWVYILRDSGVMEVKF